MIILVVILALVLVVVLMQLIRYEKELRHMAQFLRTRSRASNTTLKVQLHTRGSRELAQAINAELDDSRIEQAEIARQQKNFQAGLTHLSHDIRTPLTGARGYVQLIEHETDEAIRSRYLTSVVRRLDDLRHMLDQLFMFTQVVDPDHDLELEDVDANEVLSEVLLFLFPQFQDRGIEPTIKLDEEGRVCADKEALARIMGNLVVNALHHGVGDVAIEQQGTKYIFSNKVADPQNLDLERMFDRFYKSEETRGAQGGGLGLAIVKQLVEAMGATVSARLEGTMLYVELRLKTP